jgi:hypothetical protein
MQNRANFHNFTRRLKQVTPTGKQLSNAYYRWKTSLTDVLDFKQELLTGSSIMASLASSWHNCVVKKRFLPLNIILSIVRSQFKT